jgi:hypothetical protein
LLPICPIGFANRQPLTARSSRSFHADLLYLCKSTIYAGMTQPHPARRRPKGQSRLDQGHPLGGLVAPRKFNPRVKAEFVKDRRRSLSAQLKREPTFAEALLIERAAENEWLLRALDRRFAISQELTEAEVAARTSAENALRAALAQLMMPPTPQQPEPGTPALGSVEAAAGPSQPRYLSRTEHFPANTTPPAPPLCVHGTQPNACRICVGEKHRTQLAATGWAAGSVEYMAAQQRLADFGEI